jgi:hypothetical protein
MNAGAPSVEIEGLGASEQPAPASHGFSHSRSGRAMSRALA